MVQADPPADWSSDGPAATDSTVLGSSTTVLAAGVSAGAKIKVAAKAGRAVPPPLPPRQSTAAATMSAATPSAATPSTAAHALSSQIAAPVNAGGRWFWPALSAAAVASLGIAALVIYLDRRNRPDPIVAADTAPQRSQSAAQGGAPLPATSPSTAKPTDSSPVAQAPGAATKPATNDPPAKVPAVLGTDGANVKKPADPPAATADKSIDAPKPPLADPGQPTVHPVDPPAVVEAPAHVPPAKESPAEKPAVPEIALPNAPAGRAVRPSVERIPPRIVDVESHLTDPLAAVNYRGIPLVQLLAELSQWSTIPISFDADALAELNVSPDVPVTLQLTETTIAGVLDEALTPHGLSYSVVNHQLLIGRPRPADLRRVRYAVSDLAGETAESNAQFAALVHAIVDPFAWKETGGTATSRWIDGALVVEASESVHAQLLVFCEKVRVARGVPLRSKIDPARFRLEPRTLATKAALAEPVTVNYGRPESLARILNYLRGATRVTMLVDQIALAEQRTSIETEGTLAADHQPLGQALTSLLEPMDLAWRVVGERAIEITTPQAAVRHSEIEFYPAGELLAGDASGAPLVGRIQRELVASSQNDPAAARPSIRFDAASRMLIVSAPQNVQLRVASLLSGWRVARR